MELGSRVKVTGGYARIFEGLVGEVVALEDGMDGLIARVLFDNSAWPEWFPAAWLREVE